MLEVIISGGQTGADRAALDFALEQGFAIQGYCPNGRRAEDGPLDEKYPLQETESASYQPRTGLNVKLADATIIFNGLPEYSSGTHTAIQYAREHKKKCKVLRGFPDVMKDAASLKLWLIKHNPQKLNIAGNGEEKCPGMYAHVLAVLRQAISNQKNICVEFMPATESGEVAPQNLPSEKDIDKSIREQLTEKYGEPIRMTLDEHTALLKEFARKCGQKWK